MGGGQGCAEKMVFKQDLKDEKHVDVKNWEKEVPEKEVKKHHFFWGF